MYTSQYVVCQRSIFVPEENRDLVEKKFVILNIALIADVVTLSV